MYGWLTKAMKRSVHTCIYRLSVFDLTKYYTYDLSQAYNWYQLHHSDRVTHICVNKLTFIGEDNGLLAGRRQSIFWTNAGIMLIGPVGTKFNEMLIEIPVFSFTKRHLKMSSGKWRPFCVGVNVLIEMADFDDFKQPMAMKYAWWHKSMIWDRDNNRY